MKKLSLKKMFESLGGDDNDPRNALKRREQRFADMAGTEIKDNPGPQYSDINDSEELPVPDDLKPFLKFNEAGPFGRQMRFDLAPQLSVSVLQGKMSAGDWEVALIKNGQVDEGSIKRLGNVGEVHRFLKQAQMMAQKSSDSMTQNKSPFSMIRSKSPFNVN